MHDRPGKYNFDDIYDLDDPRGYFGTLRELDYRLPEHGGQLFPVLLEAQSEAAQAENERVSVLDLCCSYGVNAVFLKHEVSLDDLYERYGSEEVSSLSSDELAEADADYFRRRAKESPPRVAGLDVAGNAVAYGLKTGLLDEGFVEDLEETGPTEGLKEAAARADLLTVTGGISYISDRTFGRLFEAVTAPDEGGRVPWVAAFALRTVSYAPISDVLSGYGLVTEKLRERTFDQRRFVTPEERESALQTLASIGVDPEGKEETGSYHTDLYLSRPAGEAERAPIEELLAPVLDA